MLTDTNKMTQLEILFNKIENLNKWINIHKANRTNPDFELSFCNEEIKRLEDQKIKIQDEFDNLYNENN